tara:strand:- start:9028 stop:9837 length:810 start_codon:yes stop_codon:yes gene_type:complete
MDIEQLSKSQLLLLTLLVSFVTSTATGVLTVSLLEETPQTVTQTVNRVVERTIEKVEQGEAGAAVVTRETTVVVKEEDVLGDSVEAHASRVVSLHVGTTTSASVATGLFLPNQGLIASGSDGVSADEVLIKFAGGSVFEGEVVENTESGIALIKPVLGEEEALPVIGGYEFATLEGVRRGQSVFALGAGSALETGIVSVVEGSDIGTNLAQSRLPYGTTLISTLGDIIGMHVAVTEGSGAQFISAEDILGAVDAYLSSQQVAEEENATI